MTTQQLPERPNLEQLKRQAKDLLRSARTQDPAALARFRALPAFSDKPTAELGQLTLALHDAQSVVAREHGFPSWNALSDRVEELTLQFGEAATDFVRAAIDRRIGRAERLLALHPSLPRVDFHAALVTGEIESVKSQLTRQPALVRQRGGPLGWEPLLYVAHSLWAARNPAGLLATGQYLLSLGADPNTSYAWHGDADAQLPVLWAAATYSRQFELTRALLAAGARPDDGESLFHAAENGDLPTLELLREYGAHADGGPYAAPHGNTPLYFILAHHHAGSPEDPAVRRGVRWLLERGANPNRVSQAGGVAETTLHAAAAHWDAELVDLLLTRGADAHLRRGDGKTALTLAETHGRISAAAALRARGAVDELTPAEKFLAACMRGDRAEALQCSRPEWVAQYADRFPEMGRQADTAALETMLACGFSVGITDGFGATALHHAAITGNLAATRLLLAHHASLTLRDTTHDSPPLGWCHYGSLQIRAADGDYPAVARALLEAGAAVEIDAAQWGDDVQPVIAEFQRRRDA